MSQPPAAGSIKVVYIAGAGRSGSTILGNILGQIEGCAYLGEISVIWNRGLLKNRLCGCGSPFRSCETWNSIFDEAFGGMGAVNAERLTRLRARVFDPRNMARLIGAQGRFGARAPGANGDWLVEFVEATRAIYRAAQTVTGCQALIDSSHNPLYAGLLFGLPEIDLRVVHLIRDPRAVAYSRQKGKFDPGRGKAMRVTGPFMSAGGWLLWNAMVERLIARMPGRHMRAAYEQFVANPRQVVQQIMTMSGMRPAALPFRGETEALVAPSHSVSGNPARFDTGVVTLRLDNEWRAQSKVGHKWLATLLCWPLMLRYSYELFA